jgi:hypothetical protein
MSGLNEGARGAMGEKSPGEPSHGKGREEKSQMSQA